jgi:uncharacterized protein (TIGR02246 family)
MTVRSPSAARLIALSATLLAAPAAAQVVPGAPTINWDRDRNEYNMEVLKAFNEVMQAWRDGWQNEDAAAMAALYIDAASLVLPGTELIQGRDSIRSELSKALPGVLEVRTGLSEFLASDRMAYALGPFWYRMRDGDTTRTQIGTYVAILLREGRTWKIRSHVFSSTSPPERDL